MFSSLTLSTSHPNMFSFCKNPKTVSSQKQSCPAKFMGVQVHAPGFQRFPPPHPDKFRLSAAAADADLNRVIGLSGEAVIPNHVAIIMDGHGRWAKSRGLPVEHGHQAGIASLRRLIPACRQSGIKFLTVFVFSTENWKRSKGEIDCIMTIWESFARSYIMDQILRHDMKFHAIGDKSRLPEPLQSAISSAEEAGKSNEGIHLLLALNYSGRQDITEAAKSIASKVQRGDLQVNDISEGVVEQELMTNITRFPDPYLLIRTSGELRLSNFMLWQLAYTELYFVQKTFPDFEEEDLAEAIKAFQGRQRRYGGRK